MYDPYALCGLREYRTLEDGPLRLEEIHEGVVLLIGLLVSEVEGGEHHVRLAAGHDETLERLLLQEELVEGESLHVAELLLVAVLLALDVEGALDILLLGVVNLELDFLLPRGVEADANLGGVGLLAELDGDPAAGLLEVVEFGVKLLDVAARDFNADRSRREVKRSSAARVDGISGIGPNSWGGKAAIGGLATRVDRSSEVDLGLDGAGWRRTGE